MNEKAVELTDILAVLVDTQLNIVDVNKKIVKKLRRLGFNNFVFAVGTMFSFYFIYDNLNGKIRELKNEVINLKNKK